MAKRKFSRYSESHYQFVRWGLKNDEYTISSSRQLILQIDLFYLTIPDLRPAIRDELPTFCGSVVSGGLPHLYSVSVLLGHPAFVFQASLRFLRAVAHCRLFVSPLTLLKVKNLFLALYPIRSTVKKRREIKPI